MATKRRTQAEESGQPTAARNEAYEQAIASYAAAFEQLRRGEYAEARAGFEKLAAEQVEETELSDRARIYATVCAQRLAGTPAQPTNAEEYYYAGVVRANDGQHKEALQLLDHALAIEPASPRYLYARASVYALMEQADSACNDLRRAVSAEPTLRFQASNDPDFERIRDDAAFIDVIEPTPAGA